MLGEDENLLVAPSWVAGKLAQLFEFGILAAVIWEHKLYGEGGEVIARLDEQRAIVSREQLRRLLPGYVRSFIEEASPLLGLRIEGDLDTVLFVCRSASAGARSLLARARRLSTREPQSLRASQPR